MMFTFLFILARAFVMEYATRNPLKKKNVSTDNSPDQTDIMMGSEYAYKYKTKVIFKDNLNAIKK